MRQEFADATSLLCRQSGQDILEVFKRIMPVQLGGLDQAHDCSRPLAGVVCLILQLTLIGWIPAALWAVYALGQYRTDKKIEQADAKVDAAYKESERLRKDWYQAQIEDGAEQTENHLLHLFH